MQDPDQHSKDFAELRAADGRVRRQFISVELSTCQTSLEVGELELESGRWDRAEYELKVAEKGMAVAQRFLHSLAEGDRGELDSRFVELEARVEDLRAKLAGRRRGSGSQP